MTVQYLSRCVSNINSHCLLSQGLLNIKSKWIRTTSVKISHNKTLPPIGLVCGSTHWGHDTWKLEGLAIFLGKGNFMKYNLQAESGLQVHVQLSKAQRQAISHITATPAIFLNSRVCSFMPSSGYGLLLRHGRWKVSLFSSFLPLRKISPLCFSLCWSFQESTFYPGTFFFLSKKFLASIVCHRTTLSWSLATHHPSKHLHCCSPCNLTGVFAARRNNIWWLWDICVL